MKLLYIAFALFLCSLSNLNGQCPITANLQVTETALGGGTCAYDFTIAYTATGNPAVAFTISCGANIIVDVACSRRLADPVDTLFLGPIDAACCPGPFTLTYDAFSTGDCSGASCASDMVLPVVLSTWGLEVSAQKLNFYWSTELEINNDYFNIEHSYDGIFFNPIAKMKGYGNSTTLKKYQKTIDNTFQSGANYFRLKQVDWDGSISYSDVKSVKLKSSEQNQYLFPNPALDHVNFFSELSGEYLILDTTGKEIKRNSHDPGYTKIDLQDVPDGLYFLRSSTESGRVTRFIKAK